MNTSSFQEIIESIEQLSIEDQDYLFDLILKRRMERRRLEIAENVEETIKESKEGKVFKEKAQRLIACLFEDDESES